MKVFFNFNHSGAWIKSIVFTFFNAVRFFYQNQIWIMSFYNLLLTHNWVASNFFWVFENLFVFFFLPGSSFFSDGVYQRLCWEWRELILDKRKLLLRRLTEKLHDSYSLFASSSGPGTETLKQKHRRSKRGSQVGWNIMRLGVKWISTQLWGP